MIFCQHDNYKAGHSQRISKVSINHTESKIDLHHILAPFRFHIEEGILKDLHDFLCGKLEVPFYLHVIGNYPGVCLLLSL